MAGVLDLGGFASLGVPVTGCGQPQVGVVNVMSGVPDVRAVLASSLSSLSVIDLGGVRDVLPWSAGKGAPRIEALRQQGDVREP